MIEGDRSFGDPIDAIPYRFVIGNVNGLQLRVHSPSGPRRIRRSGSGSCILAWPLLFLAAYVQASEHSSELNEPAVNPPRDSSDTVEKDVDLEFIDEIVVVEQKSVSQLRTELNKADDRVFSLYNERNSIDSLDMICKKETRIGSQIKYRVCKSAYHRQLESESASDVLEGDEASTPARAPAGHYEEVRSNMARLMAEHPDLLEAVARRAILRKKIAEQKEN